VPFCPSLRQYHTQLDKIKQHKDMKESIARLLFRLSKAIEDLALSLAEQEEYQPVIDDSEVYS
jgi:hypothetical protein